LLPSTTPHDHQLDHLRLVRLETTNMFDFIIALVLDEGLGLRHSVFNPTIR
jgi:hypothetical protein